MQKESRPCATFDSSTRRRQAKLAATTAATCSSEYEAGRKIVPERQSMAALTQGYSIFILRAYADYQRTVINEPGTIQGSFLAHYYPLIDNQGS